MGGKTMGLSASHDCWDGSYSDFHEWRTWIAARIGLPLNLMQGFLQGPGSPETA